jgi:hypothetical protein
MDRAPNRGGRGHGLKPQRVETFKLFKDLKFVEKALDIVGLYVNPPEHPLVLSAEEKSQMQALDRTQPGLPMTRGRCATMTHHYKLHGTTTPFMAFDVKAATVISQCMLRHCGAEFIRFLRLTATTSTPITPIRSRSAGPRLPISSSASTNGGIFCWNRSTSHDQSRLHQASPAAPRDHGPTIVPLQASVYLFFALLIFLQGFQNKPPIRQAIL